MQRTKRLTGRKLIPRRAWTPGVKEEVIVDGACPPSPVAMAEPPAPATALRAAVAAALLIGLGGFLLRRLARRGHRRLPWLAWAVNGALAYGGVRLIGEMARQWRAAAAGIAVKRQCRADNNCGRAEVPVVPK